MIDALECRKCGREYGKGAAGTTQDLCYFCNYPYRSEEERIRDTGASSADVPAPDVDRQGD